MKKTVEERVKELCKLLPEEVQEEMKWLLYRAHFAERPRGRERLRALCKVLPKPEAKKLQQLFKGWKGDFEQEKGILDYLLTLYPAHCQDKMFFAVYGAYNCIPAEEFEQNWQYASACAG